MRLVLISMGTLLITFLIAVITRFWGLSLPYRKFDHPFFNYVTTSAQAIKIPVLNAQNFDWKKPNSNDRTAMVPKIETFTNQPKLLWVNIYTSSDHTLFSDYGFELDSFLKWARENQKFKGKYPHGYSFAEIKAFHESILPLEDALSAFPDYQFILNILSNDLDIHKSITTFVDTHNLGDRILINSPVDIIIKAVKEMRPMWIYGTSIPEVARVKSFATLGLEPAISVRGDVFVSPLKYLNRPLADERLVIEMKHRKKIVFIGPLQSTNELPLAEELKPDAIIF